MPTFGTAVAPRKSDQSGVQVTVDERRWVPNATIPLQDQKRRIRRSILAVRRGLSERERLARSHRVWQRVVTLACYQRARMVLAYAAFDGEVLTDDLIRRATASGKQIVLPVVQADQQGLALYSIDDLERDMAPGYRGILEPMPHSTRMVAPESLNLALIPGIAFDLRGGRLGYGIGFYDRLLSQLPGDVPTVGLAFDFQIMPRLPLQPHDMLLEAIVTDRRAIWGTPYAPGAEGRVARCTNVTGGRGEV
jgi:5-formyltetrahydrofolate cyclo-ligase